MNSTSATILIGCDADLVIGARVEQPSSLGLAFLIFLVVFNIITFPVTAVLNALVMISVKVKPRLRAHKSNILLAFLSLTDFFVGIVVQPAFASALIMLLLNEPRRYCILQVFRHSVVVLSLASLFHLVLLSGERYIAVKHTFAYPNLVTEGRLLVGSALVWFLSVFHSCLLLVSKTLSLPFFFLSTSVSLGMIFLFHFTVCRETRRHEQRLASEQTTREAREQFERNKKAVKLTSTIVAVLLLCFLPANISVILVLRYRSDISLEALTWFFCFSLSVALGNSLLNPIIYAARTRQFRVAFIELACRTVNIAEAEEMERRFFRCT